MQLCLPAPQTIRGVRRCNSAFSVALYLHTGSAFSTTMTPTDIPPKAEATDVFERELTELIARAFASGATIEKAWEITIPVADAPNWTVEIQKTYSDGESGNDPDLLD